MKSDRGGSQKNIQGRIHDTAPRVSVVMATYNAKEYLREAIQSILNQTFKDFEFVIIEDGSTDGTVDIIKSFEDPRIYLYRREHRGLIASLNEGIELSRGEYIARMDADDISELRRFELQVQFLDENPEYAVVGTTTEIIDTQGKTIDVSAEPLNHEDIARGLLVRNVLAHGSTMSRKEVLEEVGGYSSQTPHAEDYDLWVRIARKYKLANLPQALFKWRLNPEGVSVSKAKAQRETVDRIVDREWNARQGEERLLEVSLSDVWQERRNIDPKDEFSPLRKQSLSVIYSRLGRRLILEGKRAQALKNILASVVLSPGTAGNYFYLFMVFMPIKFLNPAEDILRPFKAKLSRIWHKLRPLSLVKVPQGGILFVRRGIYPGFDFPEAHQFAEALAKEGRSVGVVCLKSDSDPPYEVINGVKVFRLAPNTTLFRWIYQFLLIFNLWGRRFDVVHVFWGKGFSLLPLLASLSAEKWVLDVRSGHIEKSWFTRVINFAIVLDSYLFDHVITLDERLYQKIWGRFPRPRKVSFVPMGVNTKIFRNREVGGLKKELELGDKDLVFVYQGTLDKARNLDRFLRGFNLARKEMDNIKLVFVGNGSGKVQLESLAKKLGLEDAVVFIGRVPFERVPEYISLGDFGVSYVPLTEAFLNQQVTKTLEYLACGKPVLATRLPFNEEVLKPGFGVLVDDDQESVAWGIKEIVRRKGRGEFRVKKDAVSDLSWSNIVKNRLLPAYLE